MKNLSKTKSAIKRRAQRRNETRQEKIARLMIEEPRQALNEKKECICALCEKTVKPEVYEEGFCPKCYKSVSKEEARLDKEDSLF